MFKFLCLIRYLKQLCHYANKLVDIEVLQMVLPNPVFEVVVQISVSDTISETVVRISVRIDKKIK